jgi:hypothetical protein
MKFSPTAPRAQSHSDKIVEALTAQFKGLVQEDFIELWGLRNGDQAVKGSVAFKILPNGGKEYTLSSSFSYGVRIKRQQSEKCTYD